MTHGVLTMSQMELALLNDRLRRIQEALDGIEGIRGNFTRKRWTFKDDALQYADSNGTVLHGFGNV